MLTVKKNRQTSKKPFRINKKQIIDQGLDYPSGKFSNTWSMYRLGEPEENLFLAQLITPITLTAVNTAYIYEFPFDMTLTQLTPYQQTAAEVEDDDPINIRIDIMYPNKTPRTIYNKEDVTWPVGGTTLTGKQYMPACDLRFTVDGTATNLLHVSVEFEVHNIA